ncbi:hypothetical protein ABEF95_005796 [Exophiala dermatitidis]
MQTDSSLRAITNRLTVTPVEDLPRICGPLANQLANCSLESHFSDSKANKSSVVTHKLKTRISALLQDRSVSGRLTAAVLVKAVVENGGNIVLSSSESWARGLLGCLNKADPASVKVVYLMTLTRIFVLTQNQPQLLREITTPLLPQFIKTCLGLIKPVGIYNDVRPSQVSSPLLDCVLSCWAQLLPQHATLFRPEAGRIRSVCYSLLGDDVSLASSRDVAARLLCLLSSCAPKNSFNQEWSRMAMDIINSAQETADVLFRTVVEEYESNESSRQKTVAKQDFSVEARVDGNDSIGLQPWSGLYSGCLRLSTLLSLLATFLSTPTPQPVAVPVGAIMDLVGRITAVTVPPNSDSLRYHRDASKEEKEELRLILPSLHVACLDLLRTMCTIYGQALLSVFGDLAAQAAGLLQALPYHGRVRRAVYDLFGDLLERSSSKDLGLSRESFSALITECYHDLKRSMSDLNAESALTDIMDAALKPKTAPAGHNNQEQWAKDSRVRRESGVYASAWNLLPKILHHGAAPLITRQLRVELDRLAVLLDHREAMFASVMRPVLSKGGKANSPSLLPFLARSAGNDLAIEALLRPRMPVISTGAPTELNTPAAQQSTDQDLGSEESDDGQESDVLSQTESPPEKHDSSPHDGSGETTGTSKEVEVAAGVEDTSTKKRTLVDIDDTTEANADVQEVAGEREAKRLRPEEVLADISIQTTSETTSMQDVVMEGDAAVAARTSLIRGGANSSSGFATATKTNVPGPCTTTAPVTVQDGDDSDDSEIPTIDVGFDTDEEEDEEVE